MNVLFMTIAYPEVGEHNIYSDLMQEFNSNGHQVFIACSNERRSCQKTKMCKEDGKNVLRIRTGNLTGKVNIVEKGLSTVLLERLFIRAIKNHFLDINFDLIVYSTPPITFALAVKYFKKRDSAKTYLLLKDIFPQNAIDIGLIRKHSLVQKYFRAKEKRLYQLSDYIGCMSQANVDFLLKHNSDIPAEIVEVCPNSILPIKLDKVDKRHIKTKYKLPPECTIFLYGGNLGKPQGIDFVVDCLKGNANMSDRFFIICGQGSEYHKLEKFYQEQQPANVVLINGLSKLEYDQLALGCDVGLIFLDNRFTIPNFPSRLLSYMECAMPVLACTDLISDIGKVICDGRFGWWCESTESTSFKDIIDTICLSRDELSVFGDNARRYLETNYTVKTSYEIIMKHFI